MNCIRSGVITTPDPKTYSIPNTYEGTTGQAEVKKSIDPYESTTLSYSGTHTYMVKLPAQFMKRTMDWVDIICISGWRRRIALL